MAELNCKWHFAPSVGGQEQGPNDAQDDDLWSDWLSDAFAEVTDFTVNIGRISPAYLIGIDMNSRCANPPANELVFN